MHELTVFQWVYLFEVTAPVFYRVKRGYLKNEEDKKAFQHFEDMEIPHADMIKNFLITRNRGVFPWPGLFETSASAFSHIVCLFGEKAMYFFEYLFESEAVHVYTKLAKNTKDEEFKKLSLQLLEEEVPHLEFFKSKLGINSSTQTNA